MSIVISLVSDGAVFVLVALGIVVAFYWGKVADLTPEASFTLGGVGAWVAVTHLGMGGGWPLVAALALGGVSGVTTFLVATAGVPYLMSSLIVVGMSYSLGWIILGGPLAVFEQEPSLAWLAHDMTRASHAFGLVALVSLGIWRFAVSKFGLTVRAVCECPNSVPRGKTLSRYATLAILASGNAIVGLAGGLFAMQSYFVEINMGTGMIVSGLGSFLLGWAVFGFGTSVTTVIASAVVGAALLRTILVVLLANDVPAEWFRAISSAAILICLAIARAGPRGIFQGLRL